MSLLQTSSLRQLALPLGRTAFRRYLQTQPAVTAHPFDPALSKGSNKADAQTVPVWRRHTLNSQLPDSEFLNSIFDSEVAPSKDVLAKALDSAKKQPQRVQSEQTDARAPAKAAASPTPAPATATPATATATATSTATSSAKPAAPAPKTYRKFKPRKAAMTMTPNAVQHIKALLDQPEPKLLRVGVRNRGCSGLQYHLEYVDKPSKFDEEVVQDGVKVLIDSKALFSIIGSEMDWVDDKLSNRFVFHNPNIKGECGCGESFMV
ncbi:hypothetical protein BZA70DRAFT_284332 [Myxozyma melibiosi]|uniref:Core domain-containing protein n=1 Tax=Myxozyma melibiosi TaxID=54550 RepID=A0ABR1EZ79_9ASCO